MAYRFNGGNGAVTCDVCNVIIDEYLSPEDYEACYNGAMSGYKGDLCLECIKGTGGRTTDDEAVEEKLRKRREAYG